MILLIVLVISLLFTTVLMYALVANSSYSDRLATKEFEEFIKERNKEVVVSTEEV